MSYLGNYAEDYATLNFKFTTRTTAGVPSTLGGGPAISVYKGNDVTQSVAGVTLTVDFDSVTGLNNVLIDLSADAFYATGQDYQVVITTGTVDSVSVVGEVVGEFSIENRFMRGTDSSLTATTSLTEGYAADNTAATVEEMMYMIWSALSEFAISGTTITAKKLDGSTTSMTFTLDDSANPTSRTRAT